MGNKRLVPMPLFTYSYHHQRFALSAANPSPAATAPNAFVAAVAAAAMCFEQAPKEMWTSCVPFASASV
jgi:hypothetical protein